MAQQKRALTVLGEGLGSILSPHIVAKNHLKQGTVAHAFNPSTWLAKAG